MSIYQELTKQFNRGKLRVIICSGQAVVLHRLAIMSKDGDWILHEDKESLNYILSTLSQYNAKYRFGAPLDIRWMKGGWSSHFEFSWNKMRIRTDFFTRPPRIPLLELKRLWEEHKSSDLPFVNLKDLCEMKKTNREKDYVVIGEMARMMKNIDEQLLYSRSARDIIKLASEYPKTLLNVAKQRPLLARFTEGREKLEELLDAEKRGLIRKNEERLSVFLKAAEKWSSIWPSIEKEVDGESLFTAHKKITQRAEMALPFTVRVKNND